jgi:hypothetical protein
MPEVHLCKKAGNPVKTFLQFLKRSLRMLSTGVPKRPGADSARKI